MVGGEVVVLVHVGLGHELVPAPAVYVVAGVDRGRGVAVIAAAGTSIVSVRSVPASSTRVTVLMLASVIISFIVTSNIRPSNVMASIVWDSSNTRASMLANPFNNIRTPIVCSVPTTLASMTVVVWHVTNTGPPNVRASMLRVLAQVGAVAVVHPVVVAEPLGPHLLALEVEGRVLLVAVFVHLSAEHGDKTGWCKVACPSLHVAHIRIVRPLHNQAT